MIPEFYARDEQNIPQVWIARIRESMASLTPVYSANRSVREYLKTAYMPAALSYRKRAQHAGALGIEISAWRRALDQGWGTLRFGEVTVDTQGDRHHFAALGQLGDLAQAVRVELYADASGHESAPHQEMNRVEGGPDASGMSRYVANVPATRPANDYTARIVAAHPDVGTPLEATHILWQR